MPKIKINDVNLYYETYGQGQPVVFIAGFSVDHLLWQNVIEFFANKYQVIVFDNRGAGQSDAPDYPYTIEMMTEDTLGLCKALGLGPAHFIGSSMGGTIVQMLAYKYPEFVKSGIIYNSFMKLDIRFRTFSEAKYRLMQAGATPRDLIEITIPWIFSSTFLEKENVLATLIQLSLDNPYPFTLQSYRNQFHALKKFDSRNWLAKIKTPCLVIGSDQDMIDHESNMQMMANLIPNASYYRFQNAGHVPSLEQPELFNEVVLNFLAKHDEKIPVRDFIG